VICPVCHSELDIALVNTSGTPDMIATVREAWSDAEDAALLREAQRGDRQDEAGW
jgi:hypothetical protein